MTTSVQSARIDQYLESKMNRAIILLVALCPGLVACGGEGASESEVAAPAVPTEAKQANNPLAAEQQLIKDAQGIQGILDKDADRKKQAVKDSN